MAFIRKQGKVKIMYFPMAASAGAMVAGTLMKLASGVLAVADNAVAGYNIVGVLKKSITTADADYAVARLVAVEVPVEKNVVYEAPVNVGTLATTSVGLYFDLSTDDLGLSVDQSASSLDICLCTKFKTTALGEFILNIGPDASTKA